MEKNQDRLGQGPVERQEKHLEIDDALNQLENEVSKIQVFANTLSEGPIIDGEDEIAKELMPPFLSVYSNIANRVLQSSKNIAESMQLIKDMLL